MTTRRPAQLGRILRDAGRMLAHRQRLIGLAIGLLAVEAATLALVAWPAGQATSFSATARAIFDDADTVDIAVRHLAADRIGLWASLVALMLTRALFDGTIRSVYIAAIGGDGALRRPPAATVRRMAAYSLVFGALSLGVAVMAAEGYALTLFAGLAVEIVGLYADYAIVLDELGIVAALRRSWRVVRTRLGLSLGVLVLSLLVFQIDGAIFDGGFTQAPRVEPTYLVAYELSLALLTFVVDVALIAVYRGTPIEEAAAGRELLPQ